MSCEFFDIIIIYDSMMLVNQARGVSLALIALPAASLLRGTHPAHAARRARAPAASAPVAIGYSSPSRPWGHAVVLGRPG